MGCTDFKQITFPRSSPTQPRPPPSRTQNISIQTSVINLQQKPRYYEPQPKISHDPPREKPNSRSCPICWSGYNSKANFPMMVSKCGHTVCEFCCKGITKCPLCKHKINRQEMIRNYGMLDDDEQDDTLPKINQEKRSIKAARIQESEHPGNPNPRSQENQSQVPQNQQQLAQVAESCSYGHSLVLYREPPTGMDITCDKCFRRINGAFLSCRFCNYDVCCLRASFQMPEEDYECQNGHALGFCPKATNLGIQCNLCNARLIEDYWSCRHRQCDFDACSNCL